MSCWAIIAVKSPEAAKQRLAPVLSDQARAHLVRAMLERVLAAAHVAQPIGRVCLVGPSRHDCDPALPLLADPGEGLNPALASARAEASEGGATRAVFLAADLPQLTAGELGLLALAPDDTVAAATDRHGTGTNALSLPLPAGRDFAFAFGPDSFARHRAEATRLGLGFEEIHSPGLARDIDVPEDLADAADLLEER